MKLTKVGYGCGNITGLGGGGEEVSQWGKTEPQVATRPTIVIPDAQYFGSMAQTGSNSSSYG